MVDLMLLEKKLSPLFRLAIKSGAADAVALHIRRGEAANGRDGSGLTPLMIAAVHGQLEVCARLLESGADPALVSAGGKAADELAIDHGHAALGAFLARALCPQVDSVPAPEPAIHISPVSITSGAPVIDNTTASFAAGRDPTSIESPPVIAEKAFVPGGDDAELSDGDEWRDSTNGWVADDASVTPGHDEGCAASATEAQRLISLHRRISDEIDWSDTEMDLPEVRVERAPLIRDDLGAVGRLVATGLEVGYVTAASLWTVLETDCALQIERAYLVLKRVLDDLGILVEAAGVHLSLADTDAGDEELGVALDVLYEDLPDPVDLFTVFVAESRKYDLIKREDEERLGRRMDSALGALTRALASLCEREWQLAFSLKVANAPAGFLPEENEEGLEEVGAGEPAEASIEADGQKIDFATYVELVRNGVPEYGRDTAVPRPGGRDLGRLLNVALSMDPVAANAVSASIAAYETARDHLVTSNLRLATSLAYKYRNHGLPMEDLIQDANIGLMRAAEGYDFRRGFKFSTYATWWIRQSITRGVMDTARIIRVPVHLVEKINSVNRVRRELEYGREAEVSAEEIAERLSLPAEHIVRIIRADSSVLSFEECGPGREPNTPDPFDIADPVADPSQSSSDRSLSMALERMLAEFADRDRKVLVARYGFDGVDGKTLEEVGQQFSVTRERIRQIEAKALSKLRHRSRLDVLMPYAESIRISEN